MPAPRPVYPNSVVFDTRNCTQDMYLLTPDAEMSNAVMYEAGYAAMKTGVALVALTQMPNHMHNVLDDPNANVPAFNEQFHKLVAKVGNVIRNRKQNFWAAHEPTNVVRLEELEDLIRKVVYVFTNPVTAGLVERVVDWPGANGYLALITGTPIRAWRPRKFHAWKGRKNRDVMPEYIDVYFRIPARFGDPTPIIAEIVRRVTAIEEAEIAKRKITGIPVMGRNKVMRRNPFDSPTKPKKKRDFKPAIAAKKRQTRFEAIDRLKVFRREYRRARLEHLAGLPAVFPHGTYWLARHCAVAVAPAERTN